LDRATTLIILTGRRRKTPRKPSRVSDKKTERERERESERERERDLLHNSARHNQPIDKEESEKERTTV